MPNASAAKTKPAPAIAKIKAAKTETASDGDGTSLKKKDLIDRVVAASGVKKKDAKPVVEAMLAEMGEALGRGEGLQLLPFGNLRVVKSKDLASGEVVTVKVRRPGPRSPKAAAPLAEPDAGL
jgi:DNA-binding protein HU-alpha